MSFLVPRLSSHLTSAALAVALLIGAAPSVQAQQDSVFGSYATYATFVDGNILTRNWVPLITQLGARDEYTPEQLAGIERQFNGIYPEDFNASAVMTPIDLGAGFRNEVRVYWGPAGYVWFGALLHEVEDEVIVIHFRLNSDSQPIMQTYGQ